MAEDKPEFKTLNFPIPTKDYEWLILLKDEKDQSWGECLLDLVEFKIKNSN